jgi:hypothetical protein
VIFAQSGLGGIVNLIDYVEHPGEVGASLGGTELLNGEDHALLEANLAAASSRHAQFARGFVVGRVRLRGREWAEGRFTNQAQVWTPRQRAEVLTCLPCDRATWDLAASDGSVEREYWRRHEATEFCG